MGAINYYNALSNKQILQRALFTPPKGTLCHWNVEKIQHYKNNNPGMYSKAFAGLMIRLHAFIMPFFALLDTFAGLGKAIYFACRLESSKAEKAAFGAFKSLGRMFASLPSLLFLLPFPEQIYKNKKAWTEVLRKKLINQAEKDKKNVKDQKGFKDLLQDLAASLIQDSTALKKLEPFINKIMETVPWEKDKEKAISLSETYLYWFVNFLTACAEKKVPLHLIDGNFEKMMLEIIGYHSPVFRQNLTDLALNNLKYDEKIFDTWHKIIEEQQFTKQRYVSCYLLFQFNPKLEAQTLEVIKHAKFKDNHAMQILHTLLYSLATDPHLSPSVKSNILRILESTFAADNNKLTATLSAIQNINALISLRQFAELEKIVTALAEKKTKPYASLADPKIIADVFGQAFGLSDVPNLDQKYFATFGKFRNPSAIAITKGQLDKLPKGPRKKALAALREYILAVLEGRLHALRHDENQSVHLKRINALKPGFKEAWMKPRSMTIQELMPEMADSKFKNWKIEDTQDPCDLLLLATEVIGSCMQISGRPERVVLLLGYLLDGKNHAVVLKNEKGQIAARTILRAIEQKTSTKVVLARDVTYTVTANQEDKMFFGKALTKMCKFIAKEIDAPLYRLKNKGEKSGVLISHSGHKSVPFEFNNYAMQVTNGAYKIHDLRLAKPL